MTVIRKRAVWAMMALVVGLAGMSEVGFGQRGTGEERGIAAREDKPAVHQFEGELVALKIAPCEHTTGRSEIGLHALIETEEGRRNVHLGPAAHVLRRARQVPFGEPLTIEAFETDRLPEGHRIARAIHHDNGVVRLRDESLRPIWAGTARETRSRRGPPRGARRGGEDRSGMPWGPQGRQRRRSALEARPDGERSDERGWRRSERERRGRAEDPPRWRRDRGPQGRGARDDDRRRWSRDAWRDNRPDRRMHPGWHMRGRPGVQRPMRRGPDRDADEKIDGLHRAIEDLAERLERLEEGTR